MPENKKPLIITSLPKRTGKKSFFIRVGRSVLIGIVKRVVEPSEFGNAFENGEKIMELHLQSTNPKEIIVLLQEFNRLKPRLMERHIAGFFGDTPNAVLRKHFGIKTRAIEIPTPENNIERVRENYARLVKSKGFPAKYAKAPVKRVVRRFV